MNPDKLGPNSIEIIRRYADHNRNVSGVDIEYIQSLLRHIDVIEVELAESKAELMASEAVNLELLGEIMALGGSHA